jgi:tetratricopeptide (TPR) repeat protein
VRALIALGLLLAAWTWPSAVEAAVCANPAATVVSVQGSVELRRSLQSQWMVARLGDVLCPTDAIRVGARSRAALRLKSDALLRLDQDTTLTFVDGKDPATSWVDVVRGVVHFISRFPRGLKVLTPFVNGTVEGTEFWVEVAADRTLLGVFEGRVVAENTAGTVQLRSGDAAVARAGQAPTAVAIVRPRDHVAWALYYPSILDYRPEQFLDRPDQTWPAMVRRSIAAYRAGDIAGAFAALEPRPAAVDDARFFTYRAVLLLSVGRVDEAQADIAQALSLRAADAEALGLRSMIAVVQNRPDEALREAERAVAADPRSAAARLALSYAHQARADLDAALSDLRQAVAIDPASALTWARLAEVLLATGRVGEARRAADRAVDLGTSLSRPHTVRGFVLLTQTRIGDARQSFERAIVLDQADPLPRLGLGLARIRQGALEDGRREIEVAASLDPANALVRSYLGKSYYEERRDDAAAEEFRTAKRLDPSDPTPWFYDALRKQSVNQPVEALRDLETAIALNDNRAVYRSRLLLDEDLAARSASLARIYDDLGFQQLALAEGWKSVNVDPANHSAHRFLADAYSVLPRHEVARVSELLQAQLLQPVNLVPVQPQAAVGRLFILSGTGPADAGFNEFNALFERNGVSFYGNIVGGGRGTFGDSVAVAGLWNQFSGSAGQYHYETDGFRKNNDLRQDIYDVFVQARLTTQTTVQAEYRATRLDRGDVLRFDPALFDPTLRRQEDTDTARVGLRHAFSPHSLILASVARGTVEASTTLGGPDFRLETEDLGYTGEIQHILRWEPFQVVSGIGHFSGQRTSGFKLFGEPSDVADRNIHHTNGYVYASMNLPRSLVSVLGVSVDSFDGVIQREQANPKAGVMWTPLPGTTIRAEPDDRADAGSGVQPVLRRPRGHQRVALRRRRGPCAVARSSRRRGGLAARPPGAVHRHRHRHRPGGRPGHRLAGARGPRLRLLDPASLVGADRGVLLRASAPRPCVRRRGTDPEGQHAPGSAGRQPVPPLGRHGAPAWDVRRPARRVRRPVFRDAVRRGSVLGDGRLARVPPAEPVGGGVGGGQEPPGSALPLSGDRPGHSGRITRAPRAVQAQHRLLTFVL